MTLVFFKKGYGSLGLLLLLLLLLVSCGARNERSMLKFDCDNPEVCLEFERKLQVLEDHILYHKDIEYDKLIEIAKFFTEKTKIESEGDLQIYGQEPPTLIDLYNWASWYSRNYNALQ